MITLTINGDARSFDSAMTCRQLLETLELAGKRVASERNGEIVPKSRHAETALIGGDCVEIVVAVGGG